MAALEQPAIPQPRTRATAAYHLTIRLGPRQVWRWELERRWKNGALSWRHEHVATGYTVSVASARAQAETHILRIDPRPAAEIALEVGR